MELYCLEIDRKASFYCIGSHGQMVTISAFQNIKMLAEDPSSILGGSTGTWENPGPHFFFAGFLRFELSSVSTTPTTDATSKIFCFKIRGPLVSSVRARPKTMAGKKKNCNCRNSRCLKLYATYRETFRYHRASLTALLALGAQVL